jgi:hypothetical protein
MPLKMKQTLPAIQKKEAPARSAFFAKENSQPFFGGSDSFFTKSVIQPKLTVNEPNDKYEQEADAVADQVVQRLATQEVSAKKETTVQAKPLVASITPFLQTKCATCEQDDKLQKKEEEDLVQESPFELQRKPIFESNAEPPTGDDKNVHRKSATCEQEEENVQKKENSNSEATASPSFESQLSASKGNGSTLPDPVRGRMESAIGADLSDVKIHTGVYASEMSESINAKAFTHGQDIYFKNGNYNPGTPEGKNLLAHELVHTKQQGSGGLQTKIQRTDKKYKPFDPDMIQTAAKAIVDSDPKVRKTLIFYTPINDLPKGTDKVVELEKFLSGINKPILTTPTGMTLQGETPSASSKSTAPSLGMHINPTLNYPVAVSVYLHELNHYINIWYSTAAAGSQKVKNNAEGGLGIERYLNYSHLSKGKQINALGEVLNYRVELIMSQVIQDEEPENPQPQTADLRKEYQDWLKKDYTDWLTKKEKTKAWQKLSPKKQEKEKLVKIETEKQKIHDKIVKLATKAYKNWGAIANKKGKISTTGVELGFAYEKEAYSFNKKEKKNWVKNFNDNFEKQYATVVDWYEL